MELDVDYIRQNIKKRTIVRRVLKLCLHVITLSTIFAVLSLQGQPQAAFELQDAFSQVMLNSINNNGDTIQTISDLQSWLSSTLFDVIFVETYPSGASMPSSTGHRHVFLGRSSISFGVIITQSRRTSDACGNSSTSPECTGGAIDNDATNRTLGGLLARFPTNQYYKTLCNSDDNSPVSESQCNLTLFNNVRPSLLYDVVAQGFVYVALDSSSASRVQEDMALLASLGWLDALTEMVDVTVMLHNPARSIRAFVHLLFTVNRAGLITFRVSSDAYDPHPYSKAKDYARAALEAIFVALALLQTLVFFKELADQFADDDKWRIVLCRWRQVDVIMILSFFVLMAAWIAVVVHIEHIEATVPSTITSFADLQPVWLSLAHLRTATEVYRYAIFVAIILLVDRSIQRLHWHQQLNLFSRTLARSIVAVLHFIPILVLVVLCFGFLLHLTFGQRSSKMATLQDTFRTLFGIITGSESVDSFGVTASDDKVAYTLANIIFVAIVIVIGQLLMKYQPVPWTDTPTPSS